MTDKNFDTNLLRFIAAGAFSSVLMQVSRDMFSKSYFSLSITEKNLVDRATNDLIGPNYHAITANYLEPKGPNNPIGFQAPVQSQTPVATKENAEKK